MPKRRGRSAVTMPTHSTRWSTKDQPFAFEMIRANKAQVERLCLLSLKSQSAITELLNDHRMTFDAIISGNADQSGCVLGVHLDRQTPTVAAIYGLASR